MGLALTLAVAATAAALPTLNLEPLASGLATPVAVTHAGDERLFVTLKAGRIVCTVPDDRKAEAVLGAVVGPITPDVPASVLQEHTDCGLFLEVFDLDRYRSS